MKKITTFIGLFLILFGMGLQAAPTDLPEVTTDVNNPKWYTIKSYRSHKYLGKLADKNEADQLSELTTGALWYVQSSEDGYQIVNGAEGGLKLSQTFTQIPNAHGGTLGLTAEGAVWYIQKNPHNNFGVVLSKTKEPSTNSCVDDASQTHLGWWKPNANDHQGTTWIFESLDVVYAEQVKIAEALLNNKVYWSKSETVKTALHNAIPQVKPEQNTMVLDAIKKLKKAVADYENAPCIFADGTKVFLQNKMHSSYIVTATSGEPAQPSVGVSNEGLVEKSLWELQSQNSNAGEYKLYNEPSKQYVETTGTFTANKVLPLGSNGSVFTITSKLSNGKEYLVIADKKLNDGKNSLHGTNWGGVVFWEAGADASHWSVLPETEIGEYFAKEYAETADSGYVGSYTSEQLNKLKNVKTLAECDNFWKTEKPVEFVDGGYYYLTNVFRKGTIQVADGANISQQAFDKSIADMIWKVELVDGQQNVLKLQNINAEKYVSKLTANSVAEVADASQAIEFHTLDQKNGTFSLKVGASGDYMVQFSNEKIGCWSNANSKGGDGCWYIIPASELEVNMTAVEGNTYSSLYLPLAVTLPTEVKAYTGILDEAKKVLTMHEMQGTELPKNTGVVLKADQNVNKITLKFLNKEVKAVEANNGLVGSNIPVQLNEQNVAQYWVLGNGNSGIGLYHLNLKEVVEGKNKVMRATIPANKAFVNIPTGGAVNGYRLDFGDITGVEGVVEEVPAAEKVIYDLSGRRVAKMTKGLYIVNGKKVLVK